MCAVEKSETEMKASLVSFLPPESHVKPVGYAYSIRSEESLVLTTEPPLDRHSTAVVRRLDLVDRVPPFRPQPPPDLVVGPSENHPSGALRLDDVFGN